MKYETFFKKEIQQIDKALESALPGENQYPNSIHAAMRYSVFPGGKRFRPIMVFSACEASGANPSNGLAAACAVELIHCYSLVHDDLPALDNDDFRRNKPTCHKQFGEAMAVLTGDALLTIAFEILSKVRPAARAVSLVQELSTASGTYGMIGGQVADLEGLNETLTPSRLDFISIHKTGKLIKASAVMGAICGGAGKLVRERIQKFGEFTGLAFQLVDDLQDGDGYARIVKAKEVHLRVRDLIANAKREVRPLGKKADKLMALADFLLNSIPRGEHVSVDR